MFISDYLTQFPNKNPNAVICCIKILIEFANKALGPIIISSRILYIPRDSCHHLHKISSLLVFQPHQKDMDFGLRF